MHTANLLCISFVNSLRFVYILIATSFPVKTRDGGESDFMIDLVLAGVTTGRLYLSECRFVPSVLILKSLEMSRLAQCS
jgi:hypothetical protein